MQAKSSSDLLSISETLNTSSMNFSAIHQTTLCAEHLPSIEEDRELNLAKHNPTSLILQNTECSDSSSNSKLKMKSSENRIDPRLINPSDGLSNTSMNTSASLVQSHYGKRGNSGTSSWQERYPIGPLGSNPNRHPTSIRGVFPHGSARNPLTSASYAYHTPTDAFSSSYYPVSKQNSEVHSQSSGALGGGDTTDDNYSTFTDPSPYQINDSRYGRSSKSSSDLYRM